MSAVQTKFKEKINLKLNVNFNRPAKYFTIKKGCDIISIVKRICLMTISLLTALAISGGIAANAADEATQYPGDVDFKRNLTFSSLTDYSIEGDAFAFADGNAVKIFKRDSGEYSEYDAENAVTAVDIADGTIFAEYNEKSYSLTDSGFAEAEHSFPASESVIESARVLYYLDAGELVAYDMDAKTGKSLKTNCHSLKKFDSNVYVLSDNELFVCSKEQVTKVELEYIANAKDITINIGQSANILKKYSAVRFVEIDADAYVTEVDLEELGGDKFEALSVVRFNQKTTALLIAYTGNAAIVSIKDKAYAVLQDRVHEIEINAQTSNPYTTAQMIGMNIYSSPFVVSGTVANSDMMGQTVTVLNRYENELLQSVFYEVEYTSGEESLKGYVAEGFLAEVIIGDNIKPETIPDPEYSEKNDTKTILIIFAVVVLVLAATGYVAYISSKGKRRKKNKKSGADEEQKPEG